MKLNELPVILQFFLSDWIDEILEQNTDQQIDREALSDSISEVLQGFAQVLIELFPLVKGESEVEGSPFQMVISHAGLQLRSKSNPSMITDDHLFNFKLALTDIAGWESQLQHALKRKFGDLNYCIQSFTESLPSFLRSLAQQMTLQCIFKPSADGKPHECEATFELDGETIKAKCTEAENHKVTLQA